MNKYPKPRIPYVRSYDSLGDVDTTGPWFEIAGSEATGKRCYHNMDMFYVKYPQERIKDSIKWFDNRRERYVKEMGKGGIREIDSTSWEIWQIKLQKKYRYYLYVPFNYEKYELSKND